MNDLKYFGEDIRLSDPSADVVAVTPHASTSLPGGIPKALFVGTGGNLSVKMHNSGVTVVFKNVANGQVLPIRPEHVLASGTTAADIVALY